MLATFRQETTHKLSFYVKDHQFWFKNSTTGREYPLPIALIEEVVKTSDRSEAHRLARQELLRYVETPHSAK